MKNAIRFIPLAQFFFALLLAVFGAQSMAQNQVGPALQGSLGFWYAANPPLIELSQFDVLVVEPAHFDAEARGVLQQQNTQLFAYLSIGEFDGDKQHLARAGLADSTSGTVNHAWSSHVMNLADPNWHRYILARAQALQEQGYQGLFLDTLDSFQLLPQAQQQQQRSGLIELLSRLQKDLPGFQLIFNRGFEVLHELPHKPTAVAVESIYAGWSPSNGQYVAVSDNDRAWLKQQLDPIRAAGIALIAIEYLPYSRRVEARELVKKLQVEGFIPYVGTPHLDSIGLSTIEVQPRRLAVIYDKRDGDLTVNSGHVYLGGLLEYFGYRVDYFSVDQPLPVQNMPELYAGIVSWIKSGPPVNSGPFYNWLQGRLEENIPIVFFGGMPIENAALLQRLGLRKRSGDVSKKLGVDQYSKQLLGHFEAPLRVRTRGLQPLLSTNDENQVVLQLSDPLGRTYHPVLLAPWGGYALDPYVLEKGLDQSRWIIDPFTFLQKTLRLPAMPRVDSTTENGRRIATVHIDGDGFPSKAEIPDTPYSGEVVLAAFLKKYPFLTSVSMIEGEVGPKGKYPELSSVLEPIARKIFALDTVEVASHSFSHPFFWRPELAEQKEDFDPEYGYMMEIPGYDTVDYEREVLGSIDYINQRLTTTDKPVKVFFWTGDALPSAETLKLTYDKGVLNINGAVTAVKPSNPSVTGINPLLRPTAGGLQYYAPIINENVYTNLWHGPFYGFRDLLYTYDFTDKPRRLRGFNLYYHFYAGTKQASIKTMHNIYQYMQNAEPLSLWITQYIQRVKGMYNSSLAQRLDGGWQIKGLEQLRTVRIDPQMGWPNLLKSQGVAGVRDLEQGRYITLSDAQAVLYLQPQRDTAPSLEQANIPLTSWHYVNGKQLKLSFSGEFPLSFSVRYQGRCSVQFKGKNYHAERQLDLHQFSIPHKRVSDAKLICE